MSSSGHLMISTRWGLAVIFPDIIMQLIAYNHNIRLRNWPNNGCTYAVPWPQRERQVCARVSFGAVLGQEAIGVEVLRIGEVLLVPVDEVGQDEACGSFGNCAARWKILLRNITGNISNIIKEKFGTIENVIQKIVVQSYIGICQRVIEVKEFGRFMVCSQITWINQNNE